MIIFYLIIIHCASATTVMECLEKLTTRCADSGLVSVFYTSKNDSLQKTLALPPEDTNLVQVMQFIAENGRWSVIDVIEAHQVDPIKPILQVKNYVRAIIVVDIDGEVETLNHSLYIIKSRRILGPSTHVLFFISGDLLKAHQVLEYSWGVLKSVHAFVITKKDNNIFVHFLTTYSNEVKSNNCINYEPQCNLNPASNWTTARLRGYITPDGEPFVVGDTDGLCYRMMKTIADSLHMKLYAQYPKKSENPFEHYDETGELAGFQRKLDHHETDLLCGCQSLISMSITDPLPSFLKDDFAWVLPKKPFIEGWKVHAQEFDVKIWAGMGLSWLASSIVIKLVNVVHSRKHGEIFLEVYGALIGASTTKLQNNCRSFVWILFLSSIVFNTIYLSQLISYMTIPHREPQFKSDLEAAKSGIIALVHYSLRRGFFGYLSQPQHPQELKNLMLPERHRYYTTPEEGIGLVVNGSGMALFLTTQAQMKILENFLDADGNPKADMLPDTKINLIMNASPAHPLLYHFRRRMQYIIEADLVHYWLKEMQYTAKIKYLYSRTIVESDQLVQHDITIGLFILYTINIVIMLAVFVVELLNSKFHRWLSAKQGNKVFKKRNMMFGKRIRNKIN